MENNLGLRMVLSSIAAVMAESATFPIDVTKTRLQLQGEMGMLAGKARGAFGTAWGIINEEGFIGLYRGLPPALLRHVFYTSFRIAIYEKLRNTVQQEDRTTVSVAKKASIGGASGMIAQIIASPADLVKVRMQSDGQLVKLGYPPRYRGLLDAFSHILQHEGVLGLWKGVGPNVQRAFLVNMGELACYDQAKQFVISRKISQDNIIAHALASTMSGLCSTILSCPADVVKTRMMNQGTDKTRPLNLDKSKETKMTQMRYVERGCTAAYKNSFDCFFKIIQYEGILGLWKGFFPTWIRLGPWQLAFWISYEQLRRAAGISSF